MIIPAIDIMNNKVVQLKEGRDLELELDAGSIQSCFDRFSKVRNVAVIDLDAAGVGDGGNNYDLICDLVKQKRGVIVGGGIRSVSKAKSLLHEGAYKVILGTAATPENLQHLDSDRVIAAVDVRGTEVYVNGWTEGTGENVFDRIERLKPYVNHFMVTFVDREGHGQGIDLKMARKLNEAVGDRKLTVAGGTRRVEEVGVLESRGIDVQVGMALYKGNFTLADVLYNSAELQSHDSLMLIPTVVCNEDGQALGLVYSSRESLQKSIETPYAHYQSRRRGLWKKGEESGNTQIVQKIELDCDKDCLRFTVKQEGKGFCHEQTKTCWDRP